MATRISKLPFTTALAHALPFKMKVTLLDEVRLSGGKRFTLIANNSAQIGSYFLVFLESTMLRAT